MIAVGKSIAAMCLVAAALLGCSDTNNDVSAEFCGTLKQAFDVTTDSTPLDDPEFVDATADVAAATPPAEIADDFALVISLDDGTDSGVIVDEAKYDAYEQAFERFNLYLIDECGIDEALVRG